MRYVILKKERLSEFVSHLAAMEPVFAPVSRGYNNFAFEQVKDGRRIVIPYLPTLLPPKKYFMPQTERIVEYDIAAGRYEGVLEYEKMVLFGVHTCDLAGIQCLNIAFSEKPKDINYIARKNRIAIIGLECNEYCDSYASCRVMNTYLSSGGYDLFFTQLPDCFLVHVSTPLGEEFVEATGDFHPAAVSHTTALEKLREAKRKSFADEVTVRHEELKGLFDRGMDSPVWNELEQRCVACGNCTNVCPTCYCFDIRDQISLDLNTGCRVRVWDSCQTESFAKVATGENFRESRGQRQRHRYYRKFKFPYEKYGRYFCTGCGRCSRTCMARINLKETINALAAEKK